jgi:hypothetical protein
MAHFGCPIEEFHGFPRLIRRPFIANPKAFSASASELPPDNSNACSSSVNAACRSPDSIRVDQGLAQNAGRNNPR